MTNFDRRAFLRSGTRKVAEGVVDQVSKHVRDRTKHWIRPPYALDELEFLAACTRCGECIDACPYDVIFLLSSRLGAMVINTPALDLVNKGCHLCADWPCVTACKPGALKTPLKNSDETVPLPKLAEANIDPRACLPYLGPECGACASSCPVAGALAWHAGKPIIDSTQCTGCGLCREACIVDPRAINISSLYKNVKYDDGPSTKLDEQQV
jgi:ferredoxin-type protein NapG